MDDPPPQGIDSDRDVATRDQRIQELEKQVASLQTEIIQSETNIQLFCSTTSSLYTTLKQFVEEATRLGAARSELHQNNSY